MKNLTLFFLESDPDYGSRLADYLGGRTDSPFLVRLFLNHPCPEKDLRQADAAIVTSSLWLSYRDLLHDFPVLVLDEYGSPVEGAEAVVYKYQSAAHLFDALLHCFLDHSDRSLTPDSVLTRSFRIIGLSSPACGDRISSSVMSYIRAAARDHAVLYLNMEPVPSLMIRHETFDYLLPADYSGELGELDGEDWKYLAEALHRDTGYEEVFLDFGSSLPLSGALPYCDEILILRGDSLWEKEVADLFQEVLSHAASPQIRDRVRLQVCS